MSISQRNSEIETLDDTNSLTNDTDSFTSDTNSSTNDTEEVIESVGVIGTVENRNKIEDADLYEDKFIKEYFAVQAKNRITELKIKIASTKSAIEKAKYQKEISKLNDEIVNEFTEMRENESTGDFKVKNLEDFQIELKGNEIYYKGLIIPKSLVNFLFDFQQDGLKWMIDLFLLKKGGILADQMGLGKTIQAIALVITLMKNKLIDRVLILSPLSVVFQWESEIQKMFKIVGEKKFKIYTKKIPNKNNLNSELEIFLLGYESYKALVKKGDNGKSVMDDKNPITENMNFDLILLDEGHKIKNKDSQICKLCKRLKATSRFVISGTPIQNNLGELWTIVDFINPSLLGLYTDFKEEFIDNIKENNDRAYRYSVMLRSMIEPFILRRLKNEVKANLPGKKDKILFTAMTALQNSMYFQILEKVNIKSTFRKKDDNLFSAIDLLRKVCNHPLLINPRIVRNDEEIIESSCKMIALFELLEKWISCKNKVLLFTQTIQMQKIIKVAIMKYNTREATRKINFYILNGKIPQNQRKSLVKDFNVNKGVDCLLLTTKVGGVGLNLAGADRIIIYDPDWNPAIDEQAKERIYRYGQKSDVEIYRFICRNTIEEKIYHKQIFKDCISRKILTNPMTVIKNEFSEIFSYGVPLDKSVTIENDKNYDVEGDQFIKVKEKDKNLFKKLVNFNSKNTLNGLELLDYIRTRENNIN